MIQSKRHGSVAVVNVTFRGYITKSSLRVRNDVLDRSVPLGGLDIVHLIVLQHGPESMGLS